MKSKLFLTGLVFLFFVGLFTSCTTENATETDSLYEINAIDKSEVEDPDDRGNS